jgi:hypothetical protein
VAVEVAVGVPVAVATGVLLGFLGARVVLVGSGLSLVVWAVAGLALGLRFGPGPVAAAVGAVFGFALAFTFMVAGYDGADPLVTRLLPFAVLGAVGAVCGAAAAWAGQVLRPRRR